MAGPQESGPSLGESNAAQIVPPIAIPAPAPPAGRKADKPHWRARRWTSGTAMPTADARRRTDEHVRVEVVAAEDALGRHARADENVATHGCQVRP